MRSISSTGRWILAFHPGTGWICFASYEFQAFRNFKNVGHMVSCKYSSCKIGLLISTLLHLELRACRCRSISNLCLSRMIMEAASRAVVLERQYELQQESLCHTGFLSSEKGSFRTSFCYYEPVGTSMVALIQVETHLSLY